MTRHVVTGPVELDHELHGDPEAPAMVLIAGLGAHRSWWPPALVERLATEHRVILMDNRDVGRSPWLDHLGLAGAALEAWARGEPPPPPYSLHDMASDVVQLLDRLEVERAHVVGASLGGMIAQHLAFSWPQRTTTLTSIMSTTGGAGLPPGQPEVLAALTAPTPMHSEEAFVAAGVAGARLSSSSPHFDEQDAIRRNRAYWAHGVNPAGSGRQLLAVLADGDRTQRLATVTAPTLVLHGTLDPMIHVEAGRATADAVPGASFVPLTDVGHELPRAVHDDVATTLHAHTATVR